MLEELVNFQVFGTKGGIFATHLVALVGFLERSGSQKQKLAIVDKIKSTQ